METDVYANYKPTDTLSASGFMASLLPDYGLISDEREYPPFLYFPDSMRVFGEQVI